MDESKRGFKMKHEFCIAGKTRNKENILKICDLFDKYNISYYCFLKNEETINSYGNSEDVNVIEKDLRNTFSDLENEKASKNFLLVLPAGKSGHIEAGIAYGMGKKCYAIGEFDSTDSLYNIFDNIFSDIDELEEFLSNYKI